MDPSKPNDPNVDQGQPIPRSRPGDDEVLEGEVIGRGVPIGRPRTGPPPPVAPPKKPGNIRRILLLVIISAVALACLGGSLTFYFLYDKATQPDRSTPGATLEQFLDARLGGSTPERLQLLVCKSPNLAEFDDLVSQLAAQKAKTGVELRVRTSAFNIKSPTDDKADIETDLVITADQQNVVQQDKQGWHFDLTNESGWRVCGAHRIR